MVGIKINKTLRNVLIALAVIILIFAIPSFFPDQDYHAKYDNYDLNTNIGVVSAIRTYSEYLLDYSNAGNSKSEVAVDVLDYDADKSSGVHVEKNYKGKDVAYTEEDSSVTWKVDVPESGFYNISMEYIAVPSRNVNMERILYVNGEMPFSGADTLAFYRLWKDGGPVKYDNRGNSIRPTQVEVFGYQTVFFKSDLGYEVDPYKFYFKKGENTITLESTSEPMAISEIKLCPIAVYDTYEEYLAKQPSKPESYTGKDITVKVQGEDSVLRSDPSLFARYDRSSAITEPYDTKKTILNYTGGDSWKIPGQWIEWELDIPENGWYTISLKARQFFQRGYVACRSVYIDDKIPVDTLKSVGFKYDSDWQFATLSDDNNKPYKFYLTKGKHVVRLEATLGKIGKVIQEVQDSVYRLNLIYRTILVLTGEHPDLNRDYEIQKIYPQEVEAMMLESRRLYKLVDDFVAITGEKSNQISPAEVLAVQLEQFYKHPDRITKGFVTFKDNTTTLASSMLQMTETKLDIDYILVQSVNDKIKVDRSNFFKNVAHEVTSFINSYLYDSSSLGSVYKDGIDHLIEVWIVTGRDQSQVLKNMIDDSFSPTSGINVNVKLIKVESLLNAVVAGNGPDVVISTYQSHPVDYALRNANVNLKRFEDCDEVLSWFMPSAYKPYEYNNGVYALPEQQTFNLMFYRKDILEQLNLEVPETWEELIEILPTLQGNNITIGVPYPNLIAPDMTTFYSMVYQRGGQVYNQYGNKSVIDSEAGISAFKTYTSLYNSYGIPTIYDFMSRFRTGDMAIGIANYTTYNTIVVGAPEIRGLWDFTYIPGTKDSKGNINRANVSGGVCTMMIKKGIDLDDLDLSNLPEVAYSDNNGKTFAEGVIPGLDEKTWNEVVKNENRMKDSWTFMKWWVSSETQLRFGREMEALLGASARYATANKEALRQLSWNSKQIKVLEESMESTVGVPEVPGSYYTPRHIVNGTRRVINEKEDARETLIDYTRKINEELTRKRQEFNLPVAQD